MKKKYDLVVIGSGPGGYVAAIKAVQCGMSVALVEKADFGGVCLNRGCIPTKTLIHSTELLDELKICESIGIVANDVSYNIKKIHERKENVMGMLRNGLGELLKQNKIEIFKSCATILSNTKVLLKDGSGKDNIELETDKILVATGSKPIKPKISGIDLSGVITSDDLLMMNDKVPSKLVIIGGGFIAVEFASIYRSLGSEITIIEAADRIMPGMDIDISRNLTTLFKKRGINIFTSSTVNEIKSENGLAVYFEQKGEIHKESAETVLVAVGRKANTEGLFGSDLIPEMINSAIKVNENFETSIPNIYAIGDVIYGGIQLAHMASAQGTNAVLLMNNKKPQYNLASVPSCVYTRPEIASVGLTKEMAEAQGISAKVGKYIMNSNAKSLISMEDRGFIKIVFNEKTRVILGAQMMCANATDMISEMTVAVCFEKTIEEMANVIRPHPTYNEAISEVLSSLL